MKETQILLLLAILFFVHNARANPPHIVDLKAPDGTILKGTYFAAGKPGPGVLLFHQSNRTRKSWDEVAAQLAAAGINTLTVDLRGYGQTGGRSDRAKTGGDLDTAFEFLASQPGVNHG